MRLNSAIPMVYVSGHEKAPFEGTEPSGNPLNLFQRSLIIDR